MVMGIKYFCHSFRPRGDLLVVDSLLFYPMLFFIGLAILFLFDIWTKLNCVAPRLYDAKGFAHMHSQEKCIWVNMNKLEPGSISNNNYSVVRRICGWWIRGQASKLGQKKNKKYEWGLKRVGPPIKVQEKIFSWQAAGTWDIVGSWLH